MSTVKVKGTNKHLLRNVMAKFDTNFDSQSALRKKLLNGIPAENKQRLFQS